MLFTDLQLRQYQDQGMIFVRDCFSEAEIGVLCDELPELVETDAPSRVLENDGGTVRSLHGCHMTNEIFGNLVRLPRLLGPASQIVRSDVYVHQFKINTKAAFKGDVWPWHQDFVFWHHEDGMPRPRVVNVVVFLDEVNEFNGPLYLIPGSHKEGLIDVGGRTEADPAAGNPSWLASFSADLKYTLDRETVARLVKESGIVAPKGPTGSVLFFDSNIAHGSVPNISPFDRRLVFVTYNSVENIPVPVRSPRPEFLVSRDYMPLRPVADDVLLGVASTAPG